MTSDGRDPTPTADASAFALLGDPARVAILRALWESPREALPFSVLRERSGVADSGRFNYHLGKLRGRYVRRTDEGYRLRLAGWQVVGASLAGAYRTGDAVGPVPAGHPCPACGGTVEAHYVDERATVACADCGRQLTEAGVPPGVLEGYDAADLPTVVDRYMRSLVAQARLGFCPSCAGRMTARLTLDAADRPRGVDDAPLVRYGCERCPEVVLTAVAGLVAEHPTVAAFHHDRGIDLATVPTWSLGWYADGARVVSTDPLRVAVRVTVDGDVLDVEVDDAAAVASVGRAVVDEG